MEKYEEVVRYTQEGYKVTIRLNPDGSEEDIENGIVPELQFYLDNETGHNFLFCIPVKEIKKLIG